MEKPLTVIIPTLSNAAGIKYLAGYFKNKDYRIVIVDNKKINRGFAGGINYGAKNVKTKWLLILNDDIEFYDNELINGLIVYAKKKRLDAVSPLLRHPDGKMENFGYKILPKGRVELIGQTADQQKVDGLTAACLLIKTSVFKKLKGFDESFFAYLEDVDFFLRFKKAGYKMGLYEGVVKHNHMTTTKTMGNFKSRQDMVNWWRLYFKHPEKFRFNFEFVIERMRNVSGYIKASINNQIYK